MTQSDTDAFSSSAIDPNARFTIFRLRDGQEPVESGVMTVEPMDPEQLPAVAEITAAGIADGSDVRVVFNQFGMSIVHVWFKASYPLPPHSHDVDCAYYVIAGSLSLGAKVLGPGDGFFIPAGVTYTYRVGAEGVELIEFRKSQSFDFKSKANPAFWKKAKAIVDDNHENWKSAPRPSAAR